MVLTKAQLDNIKSHKTLKNEQSFIEKKMDIFYYWLQSKIPEVN